MQPTTLLADPALIVPRVRWSLPERPARRLARPRLRLGRLLLAALLVVVVGGLAYLRVWPPVDTVMSGSMTPTIRTGDMVLLQRLSGPPHVGQIVAITVPDAARSRYGYPPVVIHRVLRIAPDGQVTTKGDALEHPDPFTVSISTLRTHVVARIPAGGRALAFLSSGLGLLWLGIGAALLIGLPVLERQRDARRPPVAATDPALHARLEQITEELVELRVERLQERAEHRRRYEELADASHAQLEAVVAQAAQASNAQVRAAAQVSQAQLEAAIARVSQTQLDAVLTQVHAGVAAAVAAAVPRLSPPPPPPPPPARPAIAPASGQPAPTPIATVLGDQPAPIPFRMAADDTLAEAGDALAQLELALMPAPSPGAVAVDESAPQLAFGFDLEPQRRFARPGDDQLQLALDREPEPVPQLAFDLAPASPLAPSAPPAWDAPPPIMIRRRSGGLVGSLDRHARRALASTRFAGVLG